MAISQAEHSIFAVPPLLLHRHSTVDAPFRGANTLNEPTRLSPAARLTTAIPAAIVLGAYSILFATVPIYRDSGVFMYSARTILDGSAPYAASWDHKGPALYLLDALGLALGGGSPRGVIGLEALTLTASLLIAVRCWTSFGSALLAPAVGAAYALSFLILFEGGNLTETWLTAFSLVALSLFAKVLLLPASRRDRYLAGFAVGTALGFALATRPNNGIGMCLAAAVLVATSQAHRIRVATVVASGVGIVLASSFFLVISRGSLALMWADYVKYNREYGRAAFGDRLAELGHLSTLIALTPLFVVALIAAAHHARTPKAARGTLPIVTLAAIVAADFLSQSLSARNYLHYAVVVLPGLAVFAITGLASDGEKHLNFSRHRPSWVGAGSMSVAAIAIAITSSSVLSSMKAIAQDGLNSPGSELQSVTEVITSMTSPRDRVLVHGADTRFLVSSHRRSPATRTYIAYFLKDPHAVHQYVEQTMRGRPLLIVRAPYMQRFSDELCSSANCAEPNRSMEVFNRWVMANYQITGERHGYEFWRRNPTR